MPRTRRTATDAPEPTTDDLVAWFSEALPDDWFVAPPAVEHDRDEILVVGDLGDPPGGVPAQRQIETFRESTREERMAVADRAQRAFGRAVSWGARCGEVRAEFTTVAAPAMTRLRLAERRVLDTLIDGGVARSRSEALAWCVALVGHHEGDWIRDLAEASEAIRAVRERGPAA